MYVDVPVEVLQMNPFTAIGTDGFLVTAGTPEHFNTMTASWGTMGVLWGRNVVVLYVRKSRYTHQFLEESDGFTVSFFPSEMKEKLLRCGEYSGREYDKIGMTGLQPTFIPSPKGGERVTFKEASLVFSCTKVAVMDMQSDQFLLDEIKEFYQSGDLHTVYIGFIDSVLSNQ
ncbi:MAG: flavin reductase [Sphaerochaeta sp.]|jgi:flavin reductase (DIM6/NTAB) family NADH-FMN oxidoreductase RutF|uniref:flavin reductase n=1 Tax=Sphaerochaeta sp. TaxID=1972642 RepID=UPI003D151C00